MDFGKHSLRKGREFYKTRKIVLKGEIKETLDNGYVMGEDPRNSQKGQDKSEHL